MRNVCSTGFFYKNYVFSCFWKELRKTAQTSVRTEDWWVWNPNVLSTRPDKMLEVEHVPLF